MDTIAQSLFTLMTNLINQFLNIALTPITTMLEPILAGVLASEQLVNFYYVINAYVLPAAGFFVNLVPPMTWNAILIFITFYLALYSVVMAAHIVLKVLRVAKRLVPFM